MSEFNWWLLIVGLVVGAGLVWLILADTQRRDADVAEQELPVEADWIAKTLSDAGQEIDAATAEQVLRLHRTWLATLPPDERSAWTDDEPTEAEVAVPAAMSDARTTEADVEADLASDADDGDQPRDGMTSSGTTPVWSATDPSPRRR